MNEMKHTNKLAGEKSPYLLQHAHNPVEWLPWGDEAFDRARREDKPIFLSVGYSTCHWCHVMERESFENEAIAQIMNAHFVNVKVDREERPDVDRIYMTFVQHASGGQGGWPMSVFLTPDLKPFYGGTYLPPRDYRGQPGFATLLQYIAEAWHHDRANILKSGESVHAALQELAAQGEDEEFKELPWAEIAGKCYAQIAASYDGALGGFGQAPKFPRPVVHDFLHRYLAAGGPESAVDMSQHTLRAMALGGMNDQLGGGFHRYSVDAQWIVSHFEKMLYDQAQLAIAFLEMCQLTDDTLYWETAARTLDYVLRDLTHPNGGFFAGEDADSYPHDGAPRKEEGAFYVWTQDEIEELLGDDAKEFCEFYNVQRGGNAPPQGDPHGEFAGKNILYRRDETEESEAVRRGRERLFQARAARPRPHRDEKIIVAWNGLMISAFSRAAQVFYSDDYLIAARRCADFIKAELWDAKSKTLRRHWMNGAANVPGFAADYAFLAQGALDLFEASSDPEYLWWAEAIVRSMNEKFYDPYRGGYYDGEDTPDLLVRLKEDYDGAEPAPSSIAAMVNLRLAHLLDSDDFRRKGVATLHTFAQRLQQIPMTLPAMISAALYAAMPPLHVVIAGDQNSDDTKSLLRAVHDLFIPFKSVFVVEGGAAQSELARHVPWLAGMKPIDGKPAAYVCQNFVCRQPVTDADDLKVLLAQTS
jgi:uncharacterized protein